VNRETIIARLKQIEERLRRLGVARLYLYGSYTRDEARPDNDIKLLLINVIVLLVIIYTLAPQEGFAKEIRFDRMAVAEGVYLDCKSITFHNNELLKNIYLAGSTPDNVCRCSGEIIGKSMTFSEFKFIVDNGRYPESILEKIARSTQTCAILTSR
jgi:predicted nucleotidyltransferase